MFVNLLIEPCIAISFNKQLFNFYLVTSMNNYHPPLNRQHMQGAFAILGGIIITAIVATMILGIDIGKLYSSQRQLQQQTTLASLVAAQSVNGCLNTAGNLVVAAQESLAKNTAPADITVVSAIAGQIVTTNNLREFVANKQPYDAAQVTLTRPLPTFYALSLIGTPNLTRLQTTVSSAQILTGIFYAGSTLLNINALPTTLGPLLGNPKVTAAGYQSLADANLPIADVEAALGVPAGASPSTLASIETPLPVALNGLANSLLATGQTSAASVLLAIANTTASLPAINVGDLISANLISNGDQDVSINTLALLNSLAEDVQKASPINISTSIQLPAGISGQTFLRIDQPAQIGGGFPGYGRDGAPLGQTAKTAAATVMVRLTAINPNTLLGGLLSGIIFSNKPINIGIDISIAGGQGVLASVSCPSPQSYFDIDTNTNVTSLRMGTYTGGTATTPAALTTGTILSIAPLGIPLANISTKSVANVSIPAGSPQTLVVDGPSYPTNTATSGTSSNLATGISNLNANFLANLQCSPLNSCGSLSAITSALSTALLVPISSTVIDPLLNSLLPVLGVQVGQISVYATEPPHLTAPGTVVTQTD